MLVLSHALWRFVPSASLRRVALRNRVRARRGISLGMLCGCGLVLAVTVGCLKPTGPSETVDVVRQPELVASCTLKAEGTYTAVGETNALTLAKNAAADKGGNVLLITSLTKRDAFTTEVHGKSYACPRTR